MQHILRRDEVFLAGTRLQDVDRGEDPLIGNLTVKDDFRVTGALELFEDDLVHTAARIDQGGRDNGQGAAFFDIAGGTKEALGPLQGVGVNTSGQDLTGRRHHGIVGAAQTGHGVEQDDHIALVFDQALSLFNDHFGDLHVTGCGLVEG